MYQKAQKVSLFFSVFALMLMLAGEVYATDPEVLDPDPDAAVAMTVDALEAIEFSELPPGDYLIEVVAEGDAFVVYIVIE